MKTILIADDSAPVRSVIRSLLEKREGLRVCGEAADGMDAIKKAKELRPDLILLDVSMPKLSGAAAASILRKTMPKLPIILFTMYDEAVDALACAIGVDMVIAKPDGIQNLVQRVHELFDARFK